MIERSHTGRILFAIIMIALLWMGLGVRLAYLHLGPNDNLRARIEKIRTVEQELTVGRGRILDVHNNILALDLAVKDVCVDPKTIISNGHLRVVGAHLARMLQLDPALVFAKLNRPTRRYECVKKFVPEDTAKLIEKMQLKGVFMRDTTTRYYPHGSMMCHVLGFSNVEGVGSAGLEQKLNFYLRGRSGFRISEKDGHRRELYTHRRLEINPQEGCDIYTTIDQNIQYIVEKALDAAMVEHSAKGAWAIVERIQTGEILAMACRPAYDLNQYRTTTPNEMLNRSIGYVYEPGSTFKVAVIAAALNEGTINPDQIFNCENGNWIFQGRALHDFHPYGMLSVADIIKKSSNIGAAKIAITIGESRLEKYLRAFGFGKPTGIDLPGEEGGILRDRSKWTSLSISRIAMGHEVGVTSLQMLNMLCSIANNGFLMKPMVVQRVVDAEGRTVASFSPEVVSHPVREETAQTMQKLLARVTEQGGTGTRAQVEGFKVGGKTGTAQKAVAGGYSHDRNVASFVGFIPADSPELGIIVVVDEPQPLHTGGVVSAPIFRDIASQVVKYLDIPPNDAAPVLVLDDNPPSDEIPGENL
jgi:cell division protein FtsI (penicillin-binding protein 3)